MSLLGFRDNAVVDLKKTSADTTIMQSAKGERRRIDHALVHDKSGVAGHMVSIYRSAQNTSATGKRICRFKLGANENYIPEIVGLSLGDSQYLIGVCDAPNDGDVNITLSFTSADGND